MRRKLTNGHAFVALGANLSFGEEHPADTIRRAMAALIPLSQHLPVLSGIYESEPKDCPPDSPVYLNAVVAILPKPDEEPLTLLHKLQEIEQKFGRERSGIVNEPRTLDLDLLAFDSVEMTTDELTLPHPRAHERRFVLQPWLEIAGDDWPLKGRTLSEWLFDCQDPPLSRLQDY
ncbi:MAG TPA: 2-amino-4-hydroxy-6-hydroxymethyldihydropteridine diphosphokinase [Candidatus Acidoferrum sp.]|nr:2-amino-4-hydroxy-6-hydroxymethyldihydropteridine diphosphokinase [Candidatus Acidoferrum sp.]